MDAKLKGKFLFNFLAKDKENATDIMEAGGGYVVPGIASDQYSIDEAVNKVQELKTVTDTVSIGLGGGGDTSNWKKVLDIAAASNAGHLNQPFETASYSQGFLEGKEQKQLVNALVQPTGEKGKIQLANSKKIMNVESFLEIASALGISSIKLMPINGLVHLDELIHITKMASVYGIEGIEPAGGINLGNIGEIVEGVKNIDIGFFMPHIFGSVIDSKTGNTMPETVKMIYKEVEGL